MASAQCKQKSVGVCWGFCFSSLWKHLANLAESSLFGTNQSTLMMVNLWLIDVPNWSSTPLPWRLRSHSVHWSSEVQLQPPWRKGAERLSLQGKCPMPTATRMSHRSARMTPVVHSMWRWRCHEVPMKPGGTQFLQLAMAKSWDSIWGGLLSPGEACVAQHWKMRESTGHSLHIST